MIMDKTKFVFK